MRKHSLEHLVVTGKVEERRVRGRQRLKFLDSLSTCWEDKVSPIQIIRAAEDRLLWHQMVANVVHNGMPHNIFTASYFRLSFYSSFCG